MCSVRFSSWLVHDFPGRNPACSGISFASTCSAIRFSMSLSNHHNHHWVAAAFRVWAKATACRLQISLSCVVLFQIVSLQYLSKWSLHGLAGHTKSFLAIWSPGANKCDPSVAIETVDVPSPGPLHFPHTADYVYYFCPLSLYVMLSILLSMLICHAASLCIILASVNVSTPYVIAGNTQELYTFSSADRYVAFEEIPVFGVCSPACLNRSLYLFAQVLFLEAVVLLRAAEEMQRSLPFHAVIGHSGRCPGPEGSRMPLERM